MGRVEGVNAIDTDYIDRGDNTGMTSTLTTLTLFKYSRSSVNVADRLGIFEGERERKTLWQRNAKHFHSKQRTEGN